MKNKKILLMCKEIYSYPLYFLAKKWKEDNEIATYFFVPPETYFNKTKLNEDSYFAFKDLNGIKVFDVNQIVEEFHLTKDSTVDFNYLEYIEKKYSFYKPLNMQLLSSQLTSRLYHNRFYFKNMSYTHKLHWLILNYRNCEKIINEFQPDLIIDIDDADLARSVMLEVSYNKGIQYLTLDYPRFDDYKLITKNFGLFPSKKFIDSYKYNLTINKELEKIYIRDFQNKNKIMSKEYDGTITSQYNPDSMILIIKKMIGSFLYFFNEDIINKNLKFKIWDKDMFSGSLKYFLFYCKVYIMKNKLLKKNKYFYPPEEKDKYFYMPLHLIPESTTSVKCPLYLNEMDIIKAISKSMPVNYKLYVKEHQAMLGERPLHFYKEVNKLDNVVMVETNYYKDPKPWILKSCGVITLSGTSAYEAALLGKRSIVFSDVIFTVIDGIERAKSFEELPLLLKKITKPIDNVNSVSAYIKTVKEYGMPINIHYLISEGKKLINMQSELSSEYKLEILKLEKLFERACDFSE